MTLSLNPSVFPFVPLFFLLSLKFLLVLKSVNGVLMQFKECLKFNGSFKAVSRLFQGSFKGVSRVFQGSFQEVSRKFQECFRKVLRVFQNCFKED